MVWGAAPIPAFRISAVNYRWFHFLWSSSPDMSPVSASAPPAIRSRFTVVMNHSRWTDGGEGFCRRALCRFCCPSFAKVFFSEGQK